MTPTYSKYQIIVLKTWNLPSIPIKCAPATAIVGIFHCGLHGVCLPKQLLLWFTRKNKIPIVHGLLFTWHLKIQNTLQIPNEDLSFQPLILFKNKYLLIGLTSGFIGQIGCVLFFKTNVYKQNNNIRCKLYVMAKTNSSIIISKVWIFLAGKCSIKY